MSTNAARPAIRRGTVGGLTRERRASHLRGRLFAYAGFLAAWQGLGAFVLPQYILPSPLTVAQEMAEIVGTGIFWPHFIATITRLAVGFAVALALGVVIGIAMGRSAYWHGFFNDYTMLTLTTPGLVFALISAMIFGLSPLGPIVAIMLTAMPHVTVNVYEGVRAIPRDLLDMARAYDVDRSGRLRHVLIPAVAPYLFSAVRYGFAIAWKITALTELFGSSSGIGFQIRTEFLLFSMRGVLAWTLFLVVFALVIDRFVLARIERDFFRWRKQAFA